MPSERATEIYTAGALAITLVFLNATLAFSDPSPQQINAAVKVCIEAARARQVEDGATKPGFDAYYNAATGRVHNNATYAGSGPTIFVFEKCMAERGFPLGSKGNGGKD
jgi:hypothetical protein